MKIVIGPASKELAESIATLTGLEAVQVVQKTFPDGEAYIRLVSPVENDHVVIVQTTSPPQESRLIQLAFIADASKRNGAKRVTAIIPYLAYARQDKIFLQGENISIETVARMLHASGVDALVTINVHEPNALKKFPFPAKNLSAIPLLAEYFVKKGFKGAFALAPDKGASYIVDEAKKILGGECGHLEKKRDRYTGEVSISQKGFKIKGETVIIFDDIISTGGTIVGAAKLLKELDAKRVFAACVHPLLIDKAENRILNAGVEKIVGTNSITSHVSRVTLAPLISRELKAQKSG